MTEQVKVPEIRFAGFTDPWEQRKLGDVADLLTGYPFESRHFTDTGIPLVRGMNVKRGYLDMSADICENWSDAVGVEDYLLKAGDIVIQMDGALIGSSYAMVTPENTPSLLVQRVTRVRCGTRSRYIFQAVQRGFLRYIKSLKTETAVPHLSLSDIADYAIPVPKEEREQEHIGSFFSRLDDLITLHQRKYDKLVVFKKSMLEKMFPKDGESVPEIRFAGFTDPWEQRKLGELVVIERGGSPRPIDEYITDDTNGLNWVKIGDAPSLGRYISKTSEKIKPEGLSKTRQVHPGDLILSNSMSFGRPYIMAIEGCIHDGWLLIRDEPKSFDPMYLCHMLGTPKMLNQYRMLASGSTVNNLNKELVSNASILMPCKSEQKVIGQFFNHLDDLITLHQRKLELLQNIKKSLLDKMFV